MVYNLGVLELVLLCLQVEHILVLLGKVFDKLLHARAVAEEPLRDRSVTQRGGGIALGLLAQQVLCRRSALVGLSKLARRRGTASGQAKAQARGT